MQTASTDEMRYSRAAFILFHLQKELIFFLVTGARPGKNAATAMGYVQWPMAYGQEQGVAVPTKPNPSTRKAKAWRKMYR
jgi:hypothetical protein